MSHPVLGALLVLLATPGWAQDRRAVEQERQEFLSWVRASPISPLKAVAVREIGPPPGLSLGPPDADIPLAGSRVGRLTQEPGRVRLESAQGATTIVRGRAFALAPSWQLLVTGPPGGATVTVFGPRPIATRQPDWFTYDSTLRVLVTLAPSKTSNVIRLLAPDGVEVEATEAGVVTGRIGTSTFSLRVFRFPGTVAEETELEIYFRDETSGRGTYSAGRFVSLIPSPGGRHVVDFNRARNPFCAYNTVYPCPAPWRGNVLQVPIRGGEKYVE